MQHIDFVNSASAPEATQPVAGGATQAGPAPSKRSGGPRTEAGKRRSSLNACKHPIFSKITGLPAADLAVYNESLKHYLADYLPVGILETDLVHHIADLQFRIRRCRTIEHSLFAIGFEDFVDRFDSGLPDVDATLAESAAFSREQETVARLALYQGSLERSLYRNIREIERIQANRRAAHKRAEAEAIRLKQLAEAEGKVYDPGADFLPAAAHGQFVFSNDSIDRVIDRLDRLQRAENLPQPSAIPPQTQKPPAPKVRTA